MIVFISDLHMSDGTAGPPNIPPSAFSGTFAEIEQLAKDANAEKVTVVLLGDVFDLIRSTAWQQYAVKDRPWGDQANTDELVPDSEKAALDVLERVVAAEKNAECFEIMRKALAGFGVERLYVPGNHDRPCNMYPSLRARTGDLLGFQVPDPAKLFPHYYLDIEHGCFARHGHEWDSFNFEGETPAEGYEFAEDAYFKTPIGDVLAAEVSSTLPDEVFKRLPDDKKLPELHARLQNLFDIRPNAAMADYLAFQIKNYNNDPAITTAINGAVKELAERFEGFEFVKRWLRQHYKFFNLLSAADELFVLLQILKLAPFSALAKVMSANAKLSALFQGDNHAGSAAADFQRLDRLPELDKRILYVLYGHTHQPEQRAISVIGQPPNDRGRVYLNTGMWRPGHNKGVTNGFVSWKNLTYTVIYSPREKPSRNSKGGFPAFEVWSGALKDAPNT